MAKLLTGTRIYGTGTVDTQLFVNGTEQATSTTTGALEVIGGVGIGGNLFVGGISVLAGVQSTNIVASGTLGVTGTSTLRIVNATSATFSGTLGVTGTSVLNEVQSTNVVASGTLGVTGTSTLAGLTLVTNTTSATSTLTGALVVSGGVGIGQDLRVGGVIYGIFSGSIAGTATTATNLAGGTAGQVPFQTSPGITSFYGPGTAGNVLVSNGTSAPTYNNTLTLTGTTVASSTNTGALQVRGGVGVGGALFVGGNVSLFGNTAARKLLTLSPNTISSDVSGQNVFVQLGNPIGGNPPDISGIQFGNWSGAGEGLGSIVYNNGGATAGIQITNVIGAIRLTAPDTQAVIVTSTFAASSTATGALQVQGGVGIGRSLFVQENIVQVGGTYSTLAATYNLINTTATTVNFAGVATTLNVGATTGSTNVRNNLTVAGNLTVQGTTTIVDSTVTNIADPIITLGGGAGNAAPTIDDNKDRGIAFKWVNNGGTTSTGFFGYDDSTGYLTYIQTATITNEVVSGTKGAVDANLAGGTAMSLHYQSAVDTTAFLPAGTSGFILQTNGTGSAPTWVSAAGVSAGSATNSDTIRTIERTTNAGHFLTFVDSNNAANAYESLYTTSSFVVNPQSGNVGLGIASPTSRLDVDGDITIADKIIHSGDTNTAIRFPLADTVAIETNGSERLRVDSFGQVGINGAPPAISTTSRLFVNGDLTVANNNRSILGNLYFDTGWKYAGPGFGWGFREDAAGKLQMVRAPNNAGVAGASASVTLTDLFTFDLVNNNVGLGTATPGYKLQINGSFAATTKSFVIDHPTKEGMVLRYGSLEGPENGVYVRGRCKGKGIIELPDYWTGLVNADSITVTLTSIGKSQNLYVKEIKDNKVKIGGSRNVDCFYTVWAERKDVEKLEVEFKK